MEPVDPFPLTALFGVQGLVTVCILHIVKIKKDWTTVILYDWAVPQIL